MENIQNIYADKIIDPLFPTRSGMDRDKLDDLANSIRATGLINPITVRPSDVDGIPYWEWRGENPKLNIEHSLVHYEVVAGHRRFKACLQAGVVQIPCVVREMTDEEVFAVRAHENLFRADLNPVEEAINCGRVVGEDLTKIPKLAKDLNRSVQWVEDRLAILTYPDYLVSAIAEMKISLGVAKWLGRIEDEVYRRMFVDQAIANGLAVWQAEYYFRQWENGILKSGVEIQPPDESVEHPAPAKIMAKCAACGQVAEHPNLQNVFVHITCPDGSSDSPPKSAV